MTPALFIGLLLCKLAGSSSGSSSRKPVRKPVTDAPILIPAADPNSQTLLTAVLRGNIDEALALIDDGADVNAEDVHGNSVLLIAAQNGREGVVRSLILNGAKVNHGSWPPPFPLFLLTPAPCSRQQSQEHCSPLGRTERLDGNRRDPS